MSPTQDAARPANRRAPRRARTDRAGQPDPAGQPDEAGQPDRAGQPHEAGAAAAAAGPSRLALDAPPLPDRAEFWRWVRDSVRPVLGYLLTGLGLLSLFVAWYRVSGTAIVAQQIPYLVSGGLLGVALITLGGRAFLIEDLRRDSGRLDRLERLVQELHAVLLDRVDAPDVEALLSGPEPSEVRVLPNGATFHRAGCVLIAGKPQATVLTPRTARERGLAPCPVCEPSRPA